MLPLFTREEMRATDEAASSRYGLPSLALMECAGLSAYAHLKRRYPARLARVLIVGGEGQNGGDGWVVARHLLAAGARPTCVLVGKSERVRGDARVNLEALRALGGDLHELADGELAPLCERLASATLVVDALFGTGLSRPLQGVHERVVRLLNESALPICALDLPSGIDANSGQLLGVAIHACSTVTFAGHKLGLFQFPGADHSGEVELASIGVPVQGGELVAVIEAQDVAAALPRDRADAHKGTRGHVLAIAGSAGKTGAAVLSALGAMRAGAGLVTIAADAATQRALDHKVLEIMTAPFEESAAHDQLLALAADKRAALLGPGFGLGDARRQLARALARELPIPCVLDADALTAIGADSTQLRAARAARILTPHPAEAARLLGCSTAEVQADRYAAARALAQRSGQVAVLKGARTVIAAPDGQLRVCGSGTPALGVAGTGDVLSGALAALLVRVPPFVAAWAGVELHARAGELAARADRGLLASEVASALPRALERMRRQSASSGVL